jgi:hypothetical protein
VAERTRYDDLGDRIDKCDERISANTDRIINLESDAKLATREGTRMEQWQVLAEKRLKDLEDFAGHNRFLINFLLKLLGAVATITGVAATILKLAGKI